MNNNNSVRNVTSTRRKPVDSKVRNRRVFSVQADNNSLISRRRQIVINRPGRSVSRIHTNNNVTPKAPSQRIKPVHNIGITSYDSEQPRAQIQGVQMQTNNFQCAQVRDTKNQGAQVRNMQMQYMQAQRLARINEMKRQSANGSKKTEQAHKLAARELKQQAISQVLAKTAKKQVKAKKSMPSPRFGFKRILLATVSAAIAVVAIVYFVNLNTPNISLKVAAIQSGIEASYPAYVPRDFNLSDITSEEGKIIMNFKNTSTNSAFTLIEERSSWDSNALLNNYVRSAYGDDYTVIREQGLTLYISNSDAAWVNGGISYILKTTSGSLTKKQIKSIAVSI